MEQMPVSSSPVKRGENLTDEQRQFLLEKIEMYKDPLTDKRNDLQTIHRKKHAWERITETFNTKFSNLPRKRSIQQVQTWYKNEKARCRRVLIRQRLRQQSQSMPNESLDFRINDIPPALQLSVDKDNSIKEFKDIRSKSPESQLNHNTNDDDSEDVDIKYDFSSQANRHIIPTNTLHSPQACPQNLTNFPANHTVRESLNSLSIPSLLALTGKTDPDFHKSTPPVFQTLSKVDVANPASFLSFLREKAQSRDHFFNNDLSPTDTQQSEHMDASKSKDTIEWDLTQADKVSDSSSAHQSHSPVKFENPEEVYQRKLFDKKMHVLAVKEECIRKFYDKKESVLRVKEQYYRLKIQMLHDQVTGPTNNND